MVNDWRCHIDPTEIRAKEGVFPVLLLDIELEAVNPDRYTSVERIEGKVYYGEGDDRVYIGRIWPAHGALPEYGRNTNRASIPFEWELPRSKIEILEDKRTKDVPLTVTLRPHWRKRSVDNERVSGISAPSVSEKIEIPQSTWTDLLRESGYNEIQIFEIPGEAVIEEVPGLETAYRDLEEAFEKYRNRNTPINNCRKVLESLEEVLKGEQLDVEEETRDRLEVFLSSARSYFDLDSHSDDRIPGSGFDGEDWLMGLRVAAAAYRRVAAATE